MALRDQAERLFKRKEQAELLFKPKEERSMDGQSGTAEYRERAEAERVKTIKLKVLRLARDETSTLDETRRRTDQRLKQQKLLAAAGADKNRKGR